MTYNFEKIYLTRYPSYAVAHYRGGFFVYIGNASMLHPQNTEGMDFS